ncbi:MAG: hypothetical protein ACRCT8_12145 [Lacipirellulaceae bacterium]
MSVILSELQFEGRTLEVGEEGGYVYAAEWLVYTDDPTDDQLVVLHQGRTVGPDPLPDWMTIYALGSSLDVSAFAQSFRVDPVEPVRRQHNPGTGVVTAHGAKWRVAVTWSPLGEGKSPLETQTQFDSPLLIPTHHWTDHQRETRTVDADHTGAPVVNSAGQPLDEAIEEEVELTTLVFRKNFATAAEIRALDRAFGNKLNSDPFGGYAALHCKCLPLRKSKPFYANGVTYYRATARVLCASEPFTEKRLDRGFKVNATVGGAPTVALAGAPLIDALGAVVGWSPLNEPAPLAADGTVLPPGAARRLLTIQRRPAVSFAAPGFPFQPPP